MSTLSKLELSVRIPTGTRLPEAFAEMCHLAERLQINVVSEAYGSSGEPIKIYATPGDHGHELVEGWERRRSGQRTVRAWVGGDGP